MRVNITKKKLNALLKMVKYKIFYISTIITFYYCLTVADDDYFIINVTEDDMSSDTTYDESATVS